MTIEDSARFRGAHFWPRFEPPPAPTDVPAPAARLRLVALLRSLGYSVDEAEDALRLSRAAGHDALLRAFDCPPEIDRYLVAIDVIISLLNDKLVARLAVELLFGLQLDAAEEMARELREGGER